MKIGFLTTCPPIEYGIATYSSYLIKELRKQDNIVYIVIEYWAEGDKVHPVYISQDPDLANKIFQTMIKFGVDIVHIQHGFELHGAPLE